MYLYSERCRSSSLEVLGFRAIRTRGRRYAFVKELSLLALNQT